MDQHIKQIGKVSVIVSAASLLIACNANEETVKVSDSVEEQIIKISSLDDIYAHPSAKQYPDIRDLPEDYSKEQAKYEDCFVLGAMVFNEDLYEQFMVDYNEGISSFIRVVQNTAEGDAVITDVLYDDNTDLVYVVTDHTRDAYASQEERNIEYKTYESIGTWKPKRLYWVSYKGQLPAENDAEEISNTDDLFIIAMINERRSV